VPKSNRKLPLFPSMQCDDGCGACCGPAPITDAELAQLRAYIEKHNVPVVEQGITCPLYQNGRCAVYEVRPLVCRAFGHVEGMECRRGYNKNIPTEQAARLFDEQGPATHITHELLLMRNPMLTLEGVLQRALSQFSASGLPPAAFDEVMKILRGNP